MSRRPINKTYPATSGSMTTSRSSGYSVEEPQIKVQTTVNNVGSRKTLPNKTTVTTQTVLDTNTSSVTVKSDKEVYVSVTENLLDQRFYTNGSRFVAGNGISVNTTSNGAVTISATGTSLEKDLTPPPTPNGFTATPSISTILITHNSPVYTAGRGHNRTALYGISGSGTHTFSQASLLGEFSGNVYSFSTDPATTWSLWIKWISNDGAYSSESNKLKVTTGQDVTKLLTALTGKITSSQLYGDLGSNIESMSSLVDGLAAEAQARQAAITNEQTIRQSAIESLASNITTITASVNDNAAAIQTEQTARADAISALASDVTTLIASAPGNVDLTPVYAAIQTESTARATQTGDLYAQYSVKTDVAGLISGFGLASEAKVNESPTSAFGIRADKFWIAPPTHAQATAPTTGLYDGYTWRDTSVTPNVTKYRTGSTWSTTPTNLPFVVSTGTSVINGVTVPAGVYMNTAMIADATITSAKIGTLAADKITSGTLDAARIGASSITADKIDSRGLSIKDAQGNVILSAGTSLDYSYITPDPSWGGASSVTLTGLGGLAKNAADTLTGPISLNAAKAITIGTPALDGVTGHNGLYLGNTGIVGTKDGAATFLLSNSGDATFSGDIAGANLDIGVTPAISGTKMTGSGAHIEKNGKFALGTASKSIVYNGSDFFVNGRVINSSNFSLATPISVGSSIQLAGPVLTGASSTVSSPYFGYSLNTPSYNQPAYAILPWNGWSNVTVNYEYTIIPPYSDSTIGSLLPYSVYNSGYAVNIWLCMVADTYLHAGDWLARNDNFIPYVLSGNSIAKFTGPISGIDTSVYAHTMNASSSLSEWTNPVTRSGNFTWTANSTWDNFFQRTNGFGQTAFTTAEIEGLLNEQSSNYCAFQTGYLRRMPTDFPTAQYPLSAVINTSYSVYVRNIRLMAIVSTFSQYNYKNSAGTINYIGAPASIAGLNVSLTAL